MEELNAVLRQMIAISNQELEQFNALLFEKKLGKSAILSTPGSIPNEIYFIKKGLLRVMISDAKGEEHTIHFALENQFIADYSNFMLSSPAMYTMQALEPTELVVLPRKAVEWGYANLQEGNKLGRLIAEFYFIYQDNRIKNMYARTPKQRYDAISEVFPNIHNRVPQHMIASYLGITPVHLSRLKKADL